MPGSFDSPWIDDDSKPPSSCIRRVATSSVPVAKLAGNCGPFIRSLCKSGSLVPFQYDLECVARRLNAKTASWLVKKSRYPLPRDKKRTRESVCPKLGSKLSGRGAAEADSLGCAIESSGVAGLSS